ncbi:hypothetical protein [Pseudomonas sp.]|uniref:hypothetical protein n=1 Tax=Pseudomonas sp. TaxID=306 RepID=UPI0019B61253|nr:hypothetical protein [Pseudomonas sp.]MBC6625857.1 hypothetical protein [Pseudomonas sp.]MBP6954027.1 hypothetical protein [Pseudomonas sp.]
MGLHKIEYFSVSGPEKLAIYDSRVNFEPLQLVNTDVADEYLVSLKEGQYRHDGDPAGLGDVEVTLAVGTHLKGHVLTSTPNRTPDGVNTPGTLTFRIKVQRDM